MIIIKSISDDEEGREELRTSSVVVTFDNSSGQRVREMSGGEDEGGAQGEYYSWKPSIGASHCWKRNCCCCRSTAGARDGSSSSVLKYRSIRSKAFW